MTDCARDELNIYQRIHYCTGIVINFFDQIEKGSGQLLISSYLTSAWGKYNNATYYFKQASV
jgi:hypothetical protein